AERRERAAAEATLAATFAAVRLGDSGFLMAVDAAGGVVIRPPGLVREPDLTAVNPVSGRRLQDDVWAAAAAPEHAFAAAAPWLGDGRRAIVFVRQVRALGWYVIGVGFVDEIEDTGRRVSMVLSLVILALAAGLTLLAALLVGKLTEPLAHLAAFARDVPGTDFLRAAGGNAVLARLEKRPDRDEIGELARALAFMDGALRERVRELVATTGQRERMEGELQAATRIQMGFLPAPIQADAAGGRFRLAAELVPAREVGGDLYDFFLLDTDRLFVAIGDVSDKGVPAALFMSMTMILLRAGAERAEEPEAMLARINSGLARDNTNDMFVTLFLAVLDLRSGELRYANGGHNPPHIVSAAGVRRLEDGAGPLVGVFEPAVFMGGRTVLRPGETLFLHTDGVTEAMNGDNKEFGEAALTAVLAEWRNADPDTMLARVREAVTRHVAGAPASDDITMVCLRRDGDGG
ncbi:MAG: PP2C family protein-serine/threonine phosphatase, partial [Planctomycetes bacterium]|nr:PP2C family protein-serine/threonine phosphatase [Planctomycetota bacterium]